MTGDEAILRVGWNDDVIEQEQETLQESFQAPSLPPCWR